MARLGTSFSKAGLSSLTLFTILTLLLLAGCGQTESTNTTKASQTVPLNALRLQQPDNCDELKDYMVTSLVERFTALPRVSYNYCPAGSGTDGSLGPMPAPSDSTDTVSNSPGAGSGGAETGRTPDDVSETNNQVDGVNEADMVKADDNGIVYVVSGRHLVVAKGFPPQEMTTLKELDLGAHGTHLFLDKTQQRLVVLARYDYPIYIAEGMDTTAGADVAIAPPIQNWDVTVAIFYDVSNPQEPVMLDQLRFKGYYQDGRRIDGRVHLILRNYFYPQAFYQDAEVWQLQQAYWQAVRKVQCEHPDAGPAAIAADPAVVAAKQAFAAQVRAVFDSITIQDELPAAQRQTPQGELQPVEFLACGDIRHPKVSASLGLQIIASMDTDGKNLGATAIVNNAWLDYASKENLYVAETHRNWWWLMADGATPASQTAIYKFAISSDKPQYIATGTVNGYALNQFSFSEYNGALRVATTQDDVFYEKTEDGRFNVRRERKNNLFVLTDDNNGNLNISGAVRGFGENETIRSSRFLGERGFVVTFRQVDPLFTFDLSDPDNPQLKGELSIPGFSSYMHPYDDNHIITIGRAGGTGGIGVGSGIQLQLFDVTDVSNPKRLHEYTPPTAGGWSWSAAEYDHKAFTFYKPANLLAIPMQFAPETGSLFSGVVAYDVSLDSGFTELGRMDHSDLAYEYYCNSSVVLLPGYDSYCGNGYYLYWAAPRRSVVMTSAEDVYLYTLSDLGMKASHIGDLGTPLGSILFPPQPYPWWYYVAIDRPVSASPGGGVGEVVVF